MASGSLLQFPLRLGLAEDANPKSPPTSSMKSGSNVRWVKDGVIGKRWGFRSLDALPAGAGAPLRIVTRGDDLSVTDGTKLYTYRPTTTDWVESDRVGEVGLEWTTLIDAEGGVAQSDIIVRGNVLLHVYMAGDPSRQDGSKSPSIFTGAIYVQAIDWTTGRVIMAPQWLGGAIYMRLLLCGTYGVLVLSVGTQILSRRIQLDESIGVALESDTTVLANDVRHDDDPHGLDSRFDAITLTSGEIALAYEQTGTAALVIQKFAVPNGVPSSTGSPLAETSETGVRCVALAENATAGLIYCAYSRIMTDPSCNVRLFAAASSDLSEIISPRNIFTEFRGHHISVTPVDTNVLVVSSGISGDTSLSWPETRSVVFDTGTNAVIALTLRASAAVMMTSSLIDIGGRKYVFARDAHYGEKQHWDPTWTDGIVTGAELDGTDLSKLPSMSSYLIEVESAERTDVNDRAPHRVVGKIDHDVAAPFQQGFTGRAANIDSSTVLGATPFQATPEPASFNFRAGLRLVTATIDLARRSDPWRCATIANETYIGSGMLFAWDGRTVFDVAMRTPMILSAAENSDEGKMADGTYLYQTHAAYRSHAGILHRGPMSTTFTVTTNDGTDHLASAKITIVPNSIDSKETSETGFGGFSALMSFFSIFRSEAGGSILYERTFGPRFDVFLNQPHLVPQTFVDSLGDEDIAFNSFVATDSLTNPQVALSSRPQPYVATGELEDVQPPAPQTMCLHQGRLFLIAGDRRTIWFSKDTDDNPGIAPGFNPDFVRLFDSPAYALASYADRLLIFFERGIQFMVGDGPTVSNTDDRFSTPQPLPCEVGTTNPRSVVATPIGVFFQTADGDVYIVDGGLNATWIGKDVRATLVSYPTVTSAVHVASQREVRFSCSGDSGSIFLVFDYQRGTWFTRTTPNNANVNDACMWDGQYVFVTEDGVFVERYDAHYDLVDGQTAYVPMSVVLNPIAPSGPISWHRIKLVQILGQSIAPHKLTVALARDYATPTEQSKTWDKDSDVTAVGPLERAQVAPAHQKMQAIEVHISDADPVLDGETPTLGYGGFELEGVALLVQTKQGPARITTSRRG